MLIEVAATDASKVGQIARAYLNVGKSKYLNVTKSDRIVIVEVGADS